MNVFELIKEKLEEETDCPNCSMYCADANICGFNEMCKQAISIVNEVQKEYNNGWIPCSERLPNGNKYCLVTYQTDNKIWVDAWVFNGVDFNEVGETKVIAWQPLPAPYKEGGME